MLRKLLFLFLVVSAAHGEAQNVRQTSPKSTEKQNGAEIDYKRVGSPLPPIRVIVYKDTAVQKGMNTDNSTAAVPEEKTKRSRRKHKHAHEASETHGQGVLTNKDLDNDANLFLMVFNPTCSHCQDETIMIENNFSLFKKSRLVLLATPVTQPYIGDFLVLTHLREHPEITVGVDSAGYMDKVFLYQMLPQINIYDHERKLLKTYTGEVVIDSLKQYIE